MALPAAWQTKGLRCAVCSHISQARGAMLKCSPGPMSARRRVRIGRSRLSVRDRSAGGFSGCLGHRAPNSGNSPHWWAQRVNGANCSTTLGRSTEPAPAADSGDVNRYLRTPSRSRRHSTRWPSPLASLTLPVTLTIRQASVISKLLAPGCSLRKAIRRSVWVAFTSRAPGWRRPEGQRRPERRRSGSG